MGWNASEAPEGNNLMVSFQGLVPYRVISSKQKSVAELMSVVP